MAFAFFPIGAVGLTTVQGVSAYWVRLPIGSKPIRDIYTAGVPAVTDGKGVVMMALGVQESLVLDDCEDAWDEDVPANFTVSLDAADKMVGTSSVKVDIAAAAAAGTILCEVVAPGTALPKFTHLEFWIKSSVATAAGDLQILLGDTAKCVSPLETLNVPALVADKWTHVRVALLTPQLDTAIISLGLKYTVDIGACTIHLDDFRAVRLATVATPLQVSQFVQDDVYFALSEAVDSAYHQNALMLVYYTSPDEDPTCSN
jgi:hypothetical protein